MFRKITLSSLLLLTLLIMAVTFAGAATCPTSTATMTTYGSGSSTTTIAVAANFSQPMASFLTTYFTVAYPAYTVIMCADSTGHFEATIDAALANGQPSPYSMLFAADNSPVSKYPTFSPYLYAKGIPVLFGYLPASGQALTISGLSSLVANQTSNFITANTAGLHSKTVSTTLTGGTASVAMANPAIAPYGQEAQNILNAMLPIYGSSFNIPTNVPAWIKTPLTTYGNITLTFNAVGSAEPAGVVAKSQICGHLSDGTIAWVQFSSTDFQLQQTAVNFGTNAGGNQLNRYIKSWMTHPPASRWNSFLTTWCYVTI